MPTIRTLLATAAHHNWPVHQFDISNAFLHGKLDDVVYMRQPPGFEDSQHPHHVCLLRKALYGLKQAPRMWYSTLLSKLHNFGFTSSTADPSLLLYKTPTAQLYLLIYVDDLLLTGNNTSSIQHIIAQLQDAFQLKNLGLISTFLGITVQHTETGYFLHQQAYLRDILLKSGFQNCRPVTTPTSAKPPVTPDMDKPFDQPTHYRHLVGSLQYLTLTRPDIAYAVNQVSQQMHSPTFASFQALKRIFRYLQGTPLLGLPINAAPLHLSAYADSDWASDTTTRRSTTGYCLFLGTNLIAWRVHKQPTVARSTAEAEYRALATTATDIIWFRRLLSEFQAMPSRPTTLFCDNTSALALATNPIFHARTKHIEIDLHFVRDHITKGDIQVQHIHTHDQPADLLTKHLSTKRFQLLRAKLTIQPLDAQLEGG